MGTGAKEGISPARLSRLVMLDLPRLVSGIAVEAAWATAHLMMYPLGLFSASSAIVAGRRHDLQGLNPEQRGLLHQGVEAARTPILLIHGIIDNHAAFTVMDYALRRRGFQTVTAYDYGLLTSNVPRAALRLGEAISQLSAATGYERIHVIGHSLGGLIARYFVQRLGGDRQVHTLVTLGTPHQGTQLAWAAPLLPLVRQLTPDSPVIRELTEPAPGCRTRFVAFYSDIDHLVVPGSNARIDHPDLNVQNIATHAVGHLSMPNNRQIALTIAQVLRQLHPDGTGSTA